MKILVAGSETARLLTNLRNGLIALGHEVDTCLCTDSSSYYGDIEYDYRAPFGRFVKRVYEGEEGQPACEPTPAFYSFVDRFDVFIFVSCFTLLPGLLDLPLLKKLGKKVIVFSTGSDLRFLYPSIKLWNYLGYDFPITAVDVQMLHTLAPKFSDSKDFLTSSLVYKYALAPKLYLSSMVSLYADALLAGPCQASLITAPFFANINTVNSQGITTKIWGRKKPIIVHAPTSRELKGTDVILGALNDLRNEGVDFELVSVQKMKNEHLKKILYTADIVLDAVWCGGHGILANEAMMSGCVVLGANEPACHPLPRNRPVIPIDRQHIHARLRRAILDLPFRKRVAEYGVEYMASGVHSVESSAQYTMDTLQRVQHGDYDYYSTLFLDSPFWPEYPKFLEKIQARMYSVETKNEFPPERACMPEHVQRLLLKTLQCRGVHPQWDMEAFIATGLTGGKALQTALLPRWNLKGAHKINPWLWLGKNSSIGYPDAGCIPYAELTTGLESVFSLRHL